MHPSILKQIPIPAFPSFVQNNDTIFQCTMYTSSEPRPSAQDVPSGRGASYTSQVTGVGQWRVSLRGGARSSVLLDSRRGHSSIALRVRVPYHATKEDAPSCQIPPLNSRSNPHRKSNALHLKHIRPFACPTRISRQAFAIPRVPLFAIAFNSSRMLQHRACARSAFRASSSPVASAL